MTGRARWTRLPCAVRVALTAGPAAPGMVNGLAAPGVPSSVAAAAAMAAGAATTNRVIDRDDRRRRQEADALWTPTNTNAERHTNAE